MPPSFKSSWLRGLFTSRQAPRLPQRRRPLKLEVLEVRETPTVSPGMITTVVGDGSRPPLSRPPPWPWTPPETSSSPTTTPMSSAR